MRCEDVRTAYLAGVASAAQRDHLQSCPLCVGERATLDAILQMLGDDALWIDPPANLEQRVLTLISGEGSRFARDRAAELLDSVDLTDRMSHFPDQLSGGEQQRVSVARALVMGPKLLLADEPTGNLDHDNAERLFQLVTELHLKAGLTSIIVTHNEEMARRCDRIFRLAPRAELSEYVRKV